MNERTNQPVATVQPRSVLINMATRFGMEPAAFEQTLRATVVPNTCSREQFAAFLLVAKEYELNPLTKEIYAFPTRAGGIQPVVSVDGWCNLINSHPQLNGIEFDDHLTDDGRLTAITARVWRKDRDKPIIVTEYMSECARDTEPWKKWPRRMLRHKALIQCARYAFGFAGIVDPDEAERGAETFSPASPPAAMPSPSRVPSPPSAPPPQQTNGAKPAPITIDATAESDSIEPREVWNDPHPAPDAFDSASWRRDADGALTGCESGAELFEAKKNIIDPAKGKAAVEDWQAVMLTYKQTFDRLIAAEGSP